MQQMWSEPEIWPVANVNQNQLRYMLITVWTKIEILRDTHRDTNS